MRALSWLAPIPLLALMALLMIGPARQQSVTIDEVPHIGAGLSYLQKQDLRLNGEHPPLAKVLAAVPLVLTGARADYSSISWTFSERFFPAYLAQWVFGEAVLGRWNPRQQTVALARMPMLVLTVALGALIYICALRLGGLSGALLCLSAYVSAPVFLAFGPLVLTDIPVALFSILSLWCFARLWEAPGPSNIAWFAISLAAAMLTKFSAPLVLVAAGFVIRYSRFHPPPQGAPGRARAFAAAAGIALLIVYTVYFVLAWNQPLDIQHRIGEGTAARVIGRLLMPLWLYLRGTAMVLFTASRPAFLLGEWHPQGLPVYFPLLTAWKSPPGFIGLLIVAAVASILSKTHRDALIPRSQFMLWRVLWISCIVFASACILSRLNISFRHFTIPLALTILMLAPLPKLLHGIRTRRRTAGLFLTALTIAFASSSVFTAIAAYPHFFPYTSPLASSPAYRLFGDSNLDWNQSLGAVGRFAEANALPEILVDVYGLSDPAVEDSRARLWDCQSPAADDAGKWAVVSANSILESHNCAWLVPHIQLALAGGSMYALRLPSAIPQAGEAGGPPLPADHRKLFNLPFDLRNLMIDVARNPAQLPRAYAELESRLAPAGFADDLYPPKERVQWPWSSWFSQQ